MTDETRKGQGQARPGNDNARGHKAPPPPWYTMTSKLFYAGMKLHGPRESYRLHDGKYYAGDTSVTVHMPSDWRRIKNPARPIIVSTPDGPVFARDHEEARAAASLATKKINDAKRDARLKKSPLSDPIISADLMRALKTL